MDGGIITGMNGLIIGIAKLRGNKGICLLGEKSGYVFDAKYSKPILETLPSMVHMRIDMTSLEKKAKDTEVLIQAIEQQVPGTSGKIMESQHGMTHKPADTGYIS
jgi:uncharacterized protein